MEIENGIIESTRLSIADHGLLSGWIFLKFKGSGQGFGGMSLYLPTDFKHHKGQFNYAGHWIFRVIQIAGVEEWDQLIGKTIRVQRKSTFGTIDQIGHIVNDDWFNPEEEFKNL